MKNRIASLFLVFALLMSLCVSVAARDNPITVQSGGAERFTDVPTDHWAYAYINKVVGSGLFNGKTPTTFEPSNAMTRSQFVMVMARMEGRSDLEGVVLDSQPFPDVTTTRRAAGPIAWAVEQGFVYGFGDGTFKPDSPINRGQFAALIHRYITAKGYTNLNAVDPEPAQFTDAASVSTAFTADVEYARIHGLLTGYSDGTVRSGNPITRAAIAAILARFLDLVSESIDTKSGQYYVPLLDYPRPDSGDSGDSGNTGGTTTPTSYEEIKLVVNNESHGSTPTVSATRNGAAVAADDLQQGDRVVITYKPDDGYVATVRVRDANKRTVALNRIDANSSWFYMPKAQPVTVTVTYSLATSNNGGGGGGGGGGGYSSTYYVSATVNSDPANSGTVYLANPAPATTEAVNKNQTFSEAKYGRTAIPFYAVLTPAEGFTFRNAAPNVSDIAISPDGVATVSDAQVFNAANGSRMYLITVNDQAYVNTIITVTGLFKEGSSTPSEGTEYTWTVNAVGEHANFTVSATAPTAASTADSASGEGKFSVASGDTFANGEMYVAVAPQTGYKFSDNNAPTTDNAGEPQLQPGATDSLRVYKLTKTLTANDTTKFTAFMAPAQGTDNTYPVTVVTKVYKNGQEYLLTDSAVTDAERDNIPLATAKAKATWDEVVAVTIPQTAGYGVGYRFKSITVDNGNIAATGPKVVTYSTNPTTGETTATATAPAKASDTDAPATLQYEFVMPDKALDNVSTNEVVTVVYELIPDEAANYTVNVVMQTKTGSATATSEAGGSLVVNVHGINIPLPGEATTNERYTLSGSNGNYTITVPVKPSEYLAAYPAQAAKDANPANWKLPIYVSGSPIASDGYEYPGALTGAVAYSLEKDPTTNQYKPVPDSYYTVAQGATNTVTVTFDKTTTFAYNLTILGSGSVDVKFNNDTLTRSNSGDASRTFSLTKTADAGAVTLSSPSPASGYEYDSEIQVTRKPATGDPVTTTANFDESISIPADGSVDLVVNFHPPRTSAIPFKVIVGTGGSAKIKAEGGKLLAFGSATDATDAFNKLNGGASEDKLDGVDSKTYYAYNDSIITITPTATGSNKVYSIFATDTGYTLTTVTSAKLYDAIPSDKAFSFKLTKASTAEVTFGAANSTDPFNALLQAPYTGTVDALAASAQLISHSRKISTTSQILDVLYSLNNGQSTGYTSDSSNIENFFRGTPDLMTRALAYYMRRPTTGDEKNGQAALKEMLEESVKETLGANVKTMVDAEMEKLTEDKTTVSGPLGTELTNLGAMTQTGIQVEGAAKSTIVKQILDKDTTAGDANLRTQFNNGTIKESDFTVTVSATPVLLGATDQSVQTQLETFIMDYLRGLDVVFDAENPPKATITVTSTAVQETASGASFDITIHATAKFKQEPALVKPAGGFAAYADKLNIWANVALTDVQLNGQSVMNRLPANFSLDDPLYSIGKDEFGSQATKIESDIKSALDKVDASIDSTWNDKLHGANGLMDANNTVVVNFAQVLSEELLDAVVDKALDDAVAELVEKVDSININGDAPATRTAVKNLYHKFVKFNKGNANILTILTMDPSKENVIGKTAGDDLVLTLNLNEILRDSATTSNQNKTSYEKLIELLVAVRDGMSADIRAKGSGQTAQGVFADLIDRQIAHGRGMSATKWGEAGASFTNRTAERRELSNLLAGLLMSSLNDPMEKAWQPFEDSGYRSVDFRVNLDAAKRGKLEGLVQSLNNALGLSGNQIEVGFQVTQNVTKLA